MRRTAEVPTVPNDISNCAEWLLSIDRGELDSEMRSGIYIQEKYGKTPAQLKSFLIKKYSKEIAEHICFNDTFGYKFSSK